MDELSLLREMRADVPPPTPEAVAAARARIARRPRRFRLVPVAVAVAGAAAVLALPVVSLDRQPPRDAAAAEVLRQASRAAAAPPAATGRYWYVRASGEGTAGNVMLGGSVTYTERVETSSESWTSKDGPNRYTNRTLSREPYGPRDAELMRKHPTQAWDPEPTHDQPGPATFTFGQIEPLSWDELMALPTDPDKLEKRIRKASHEGRNGSVEAEMWVVVSDLLRESPAPPALRAALWEVAARLPGARLIGDVTDPRGRPAKSLAYEAPGDGTQDRILVDPVTGRLLAQETWLVDRVDWIDAEPGTRIGWTAYEVAGFVNSFDDRL